MFRANPGFQLSLIMLVLFTAYVMQVKHQPYMSTVQRKEVILDHQEKAKNGHPLHLALAASLREALAISSGGNDVIRKRAFRMGESSTYENTRTKALKKARRKKAKREYFWDYNTVEQVLLSCGIFVCLAGVMFESDRFSLEDGPNEPGKASFEWQRELIVYSVMIVVFFSFVFYLAVFTSEALGITPSWVKKCFAKKHKTHIDKLIEMGRKGDGEGGVEMVLSVNPLQQANDHLDRIKAYEAANEAKMTEMRATHAHQLKSVMRNVDSRSRNKKKKGRGARSQKSKAFGQHMTNNEIGTETVMKERMDAEKSHEMTR